MSNPKRVKYMPPATLKEDCCMFSIINNIEPNIEAVINTKNAYMHARLDRIILSSTLKLFVSANITAIAAKGVITKNNFIGSKTNVS